jgi:hypothetical protein
MLDWRGIEVEAVRSAGGVLALADPWANVVRTGVVPWPPPELMQKLYQSRQVRAFREPDTTTVTKMLGFYSDLQSLHSEDAITWSVFGPIVYGPPDQRANFVKALLALIGVPSGPVVRANVWLWRRLPHPDTLVPGGPEIDFGVQTPEVFLLGETKWLSSVAPRQGVRGDKDQIALRREFCEKYGRRLVAGCERFVVLGVSIHGRLVSWADAEAEGIALHARDVTWKQLADLDAHPYSDESGPISRGSVVILISNDNTLHRMLCTGSDCLAKRR